MRGSRLFLGVVIFLFSMEQSMAQTVRLEDLNLDLVATGWGDITAKRSCEGNQLRIAGKSFEHGLGVHAESKMLVSLDGNAERFTATVGVDSEIGEGNATIEFIVSLDGNVVYKSGVMRRDTPAKNIDINLGGVSRLLLQVTGAGDGISYDHADWCDAVITYSAKRPKLMELNADFIPPALYPERADRWLSPGDTTYYVDPANGSDTNSGLSEDNAWLTFVPINQILFNEGDRVEVVRGAEFRTTLMPMTKGGLKKPLVINFAPGRYDFYPDNQVKRKLHISNTNDRPKDPKAIAIYIKDTCDIRLQGAETYLYMRDKMIEVVVDHSEDISFSGIHLDYHRPTVSEYWVEKIGDKYADIRIHRDSTYKIADNALYWVGGSWSYRAGGHAQRFDHKTNIVKRNNCPLGRITGVEELEPYLLRVKWANNNPGFHKNITYQARTLVRECVGVFQERSKNILWENSELNFLHGMGVVSQFCENITFRNMRMAPNRNSGRTCAAWADILHFSGCGGDIKVYDVFFSGANDDAINVHGTHLRITERISDRKIKVRYMHHQAYGFEQYQVGDEIDFIRTRLMTPYATNHVTSVERLNEREYILGLAKDAPLNIEPKDVIENVTWTASLHVNNSVVERIPTRGFLITTRKKILIENTVFWAPPMAGLLLEDDASGWYESGFIRDMTVRNCHFFDCDIIFSPKAQGYEGEGVHKNIIITGNKFFRDGHIVKAHHTDDMKIEGNKIYTTQNNRDEKSLVSADKCKNVSIGGNKIITVPNLREAYGATPHGKYSLPVETTP